jgi:exodeoxyribonuclease VII small subunit
MAEISFEKAMKRIEEIVADLEKGDMPLDMALKRFEEAVKLAKKCNRSLDEAEAKIQKLVKNEDESFRLEPLDQTGED